MRDDSRRSTNTVLSRLRGSTTSVLDDAEVTDPMPVGRVRLRRRVFRSPSEIRQRSKPQHLEPGRSTSSPTPALPIPEPPRSARMSISWSDLRECHRNRRSHGAAAF
jgi:hypothetical protein